MSYYYGSPARGDYKTYGYAGDPGFLSKLWKGFTKVAKFIPGPIGTIATAIGGGAALTKMIPTPPSFPGVGTGMQQFAGPTKQWPSALGPRQPGWQAPTTKGMYPYDPAACPTGYHLAKDGSGRLVRNRRMNIANPRALRRAMRRVQGFEKLAKRTITFTKRVRMKK